MSLCKQGVAELTEMTTLHIMQLLPLELQTPPAPDASIGSRGVGVACLLHLHLISFAGPIMRSLCCPGKRNVVISRKRRDKQTDNCFRFGNYCKRLLIVHLVGTPTKDAKSRPVEAFGNW